MVSMNVIIIVYWMISFISLFMYFKIVTAYASRLVYGELDAAKVVCVGFLVSIFWPLFYGYIFIEIIAATLFKKIKPKD